MCDADHGLDSAALLPDKVAEQLVRKDHPVTSVEAARITVKGLRERQLRVLLVLEAEDRWWTHLDLQRRKIIDPKTNWPMKGSTVRTRVSELVYAGLAVRCTRGGAKHRQQGTNRLKWIASKHADLIDLQAERDREHKRNDSEYRLAVLDYFIARKKRNA
jgi:hypothetical protein